MVNNLIEIPFEKWTTLRDMYVNRKDCASCYNLLQTLINWRGKELGFTLNIYSLNGSWETDGTFVAKFLSQVYFNTCAKNLQCLVKALNCLKSSESYLLCGYQDFVAPAVEQHFIDSGLEIEVYKPTKCVWYHIPKEKAVLFTVDSFNNLDFRTLEECHAEKINNVWPHKAPGSIEFVKLLIRQNDSVGLFEDNNLVAWCLILPLGSLGLLQVSDSYKRKGFGSSVVRYFTVLLSQKGVEVTAPVVAQNVASRAMFEKLGFKLIDKVYWAEKPAKK